MHQFIQNFVRISNAISTNIAVKKREFSLKPVICSGIQKHFSNESNLKKNLPKKIFTQPKQNSYWEWKNCRNKNSICIQVRTFAALLDALTHISDMIQMVIHSLPSMK